MRPRYSFSSRRTGHVANMRKQKKKFPSIAEEILHEADIIIEVLDARFLKETQNSEIEEYIKLKNKKIIHAINKADLINLENIDEMPEKSVLVSCKDRKGINELRNIIKIISSQLKKEKVIIGILGYPNTGKSSLINVLIGRNSAATSSQAGYTKSMQKIKLTEGIFVLDSPGVIPKKEYSSVESKKIAKHAKIGARTYSSVGDPEQIITEIMREFPGLLEKHYDINAEGNSEILIEELGRRKNFFKKKGIVETDKASRLILKDWQEGKIKVR
jgi:ribosome biogenesis GTPase A